jgi:hypothetical protein
MTYNKLKPLKGASIRDLEVKDLWNKKLKFQVATQGAHYKLY